MPSSGVQVVCPCIQLTVRRPGGLRRSKKRLQVDGVSALEVVRGSDRWRRRHFDGCNLGVGRSRSGRCCLAVDISCRAHHRRDRSIVCDQSLDARQGEDQAEDCDLGRTLKRTSSLEIGHLSCVYYEVSLHLSFARALRIGRGSLSCDRSETAAGPILGESWPPP